MRKLQKQAEQAFGVFRFETGKPTGGSSGDRLRGGKMADLLAAQGFEGVRLFDKIPFEDQLEVNAYPPSLD